MAIAVAIVIAAILFLIDRNHVWRQVWKITKWTVLVVVVLAVVGFGGFYWYATWSDARDARERAAQETAEQDKTNKAIADRWAQLAPFQKDLCGDMNITVFNGQSGTFPDGGEIACTSKTGETLYSDAAYVSASGCALLISKFSMFACHLNPADIPADMSAAVPLPKRAPRAHERHLKCTTPTNLTETSEGNLKTGDVSVNEIVTLLEYDGTGNVKVRTASGKVGWAVDTCFEVVN